MCEKWAAACTILVLSLRLSRKKERARRWKRCSIRVEGTGALSPLDRYTQRCDYRVLCLDRASQPVCQPVCQCVMSRRNLMPGEWRRESSATTHRLQVHFFAKDIFPLKLGRRQQHKRLLHSLLPPQWNERAHSARVAARVIFSSHILSIIFMRGGYDIMIMPTLSFNWYNLWQVMLHVTLILLSVCDYCTDKQSH